MYQLIIVDDEKAIAEGISALFPWNKLGFEAISFTDPRIALSYIRSHGADVVLSDIEMPGMTGIDLCRERMYLLYFCPVIRIMIISAARFSTAWRTIF